MSDLNSIPSGVAAPTQCVMEYAIDAWQRSTLFFDVLRQRGNIYLDHAHAGKPPVLAFKYEVVADGRALPRPPRQRRAVQLVLVASVLCAVTCEVISNAIERIL